MGPRADLPAAAWPATASVLATLRRRAELLLGGGTIATALGLVTLVAAALAGRDDDLVGPAGPIAFLALAVGLPTLGFGAVAAVRLVRVRRVLDVAPWQVAAASIAVVVGGSVKVEPVVLLGLRLPDGTRLRLRLATGRSEHRHVAAPDLTPPPLWVAQGADGRAVVSAAGGELPVVARPARSLGRSGADLEPPSDGLHVTRFTR